MSKNEDLVRPVSLEVLLSMWWIVLRMCLLPMLSADWVAKEHLDEPTEHDEPTSPQ